jgi:hypothetical protein
MPKATSTSQVLSSDRNNSFGIAFMEDTMDLDLDAEDEGGDPREELDRYLRGPREKVVPDLLAWWRV